MPAACSRRRPGCATSACRRPQRRGVPRGLGAALLLLALLVLGAAVVVLVLVGIASEEPQLSASLASAKDTLEGWLRDAGVSSSDAAAGQAGRQLVGQHGTARVGQRRHGRHRAAVRARVLLVAHRPERVLPDEGRPGDPRGLEDHAGVPLPLAHTISGRVLQSLRGYFVGVTAGRGLQRGRRRRRRADPRRPAAGDDRPGHLPRRLHPRTSARGPRARSPSRARRGSSRPRRSG